MFKGHFLQMGVFSYTETKRSTSAGLYNFIPIDIQKVFTEEVAYIQFASFYTIFIPKISGFFWQIYRVMKLDPRCPL